MILANGNLGLYNDATIKGQAGGAQAVSSQQLH